MNMEQQPSQKKRFDPKPGIVIILIVAIVGGGIWWWSENRHRFYPKRWGVVVPGNIYRSGQLDQHLVAEILQDHGVDLILCLRPHEPDQPDHLAEREAAEALGIEMLEFDLSGDGTGNLEHFVTAVKTMDDVRQRGDQVLVHCAAGAYRTGVAVSFYRLLIEGADPATIRPELLSYGWREKSDDKLIDYLNDNMPVMAERLQEEGVIDWIPDVIPRLPDAE